MLQREPQSLAKAEDRCSDPLPKAYLVSEMGTTKPTEKLNKDVGEMGTQPQNQLKRPKKLRNRMPGSHQTDLSASLEAVWSLVV